MRHFNPIRICAWAAVYLFAGTTVWAESQTQPPTAPAAAPTPAAIAVAGQSTLGSERQDSTPQEDLSRALGLSFEFPSLRFGLERSHDTTNFAPNDQLNVGLEGKYDGYRAGFSLPLPVEGDSVRTKGRTQHFDGHIGHFFDRFGGDLSYQTYKGFYLDDGHISDNGKTAFPQRADVRSQFISATFYYSFSPKSYPLSSLTDLDNHEERRGGGILAFMGLNEFDMDGAKPLIVETGLRKARLQTLALGAGYGYRWTRGGHKLNGCLLVGLGPQKQTLTYVDSEASPERQTRLSVEAVVNGSYSYHWREWQAGLLLKATSLSSDLGRDQKVSAEGIGGKVFVSRIF